MNIICKIIINYKNCKVSNKFITKIIQIILHAHISLYAYLCKWHRTILRKTAEVSTFSRPKKTATTSLTYITEYKSTTRVSSKRGIDLWKCRCNQVALDFLNRTRAWLKPGSCSSNLDTSFRVIHLMPSPLLVYQ